MRTFDGWLQSCKKIPVWAFLNSGSYAGKMVSVDFFDCLGGRMNPRVEKIE